MTQQFGADFLQSCHEQLAAFVSVKKRRRVKELLRDAEYELGRVQRQEEAAHGALRQRFEYLSGADRAADLGSLGRDELIAFLRREGALLQEGISQLAEIREDRDASRDSSERMRLEIAGGISGLAELAHRAGAIEQRIEDLKYEARICAEECSLSSMVLDPEATEYLSSLYEETLRRLGRPGNALRIEDFYPLLCDMSNALCVEMAKRYRESLALSRDDEQASLDDDADVLRSAESETEDGADGGSSVEEDDESSAKSAAAKTKGSSEFSLLSATIALTEEDRQSMSAEEISAITGEGRNNRSSSGSVLSTDEYDRRQGMESRAAHRRDMDEAMLKLSRLESRLNIADDDGADRIRTVGVIVHEEGRDAQRGRGGGKSGSLRKAAGAEASANDAEAVDDGGLGAAEQGEADASAGRAGSGFDDIDSLLDLIRKQTESD